MNFQPRKFTPPTEPAAAPSALRSRLFRKYVVLFVAVVCAALVVNGISEIWFSYQQLQLLLLRVQREQAIGAAGKIEQFIKEIEGQLGWTTQLPLRPENLKDRHLDLVRLLQQAPAITQITQLDDSGREQLRAARFELDDIGS